MAAGYLRAKNGFMLADRTVIKGGQVVAANDRVVKGREHLFEPFDEVAEAATRAPNERRLLPKRNPDAVVMSAAGKRSQRKTGDRKNPTMPTRKAAAKKPESEPTQAEPAEPATEGKADD